MRTIGTSLLFCGLLACGGEESPDPPPDVAGSAELPWYRQSFPTKPAAVSASGQPLPFVSSWTELVNSPPSAWSWDEAAGILWLRRAPGQHAAQIQ